MSTDTENTVTEDLIGGTEAKAPAKTKATVPAGAKKPADRKPKESEKSDFTEITVRGITLKIPTDALDDFELMDDLNELDQNENPSRLPSILRRLVGDQWNTVIEALRGPNGRVGIEDGAEFVGEVIEAVAPKS